MSYQEWQAFKPGVVVHLCNPGAWGLEAEGSVVQGYSHREYTEFKTNLYYMRPCFNKNKKKTKSKMLSSVIEKIIPGSFNSLDHDTVKKVQETEKVISAMNSI